MNDKIPDGARTPCTLDTQTSIASTNDDHEVQTWAHTASIEHVVHALQTDTVCVPVASAVPTSNFLLTK